MYAHLHTRSWFSFQAGGSPPEALAQRAAALEMPAIALTDVHGVYGAVRFQKACRASGVKPIFGAEIIVEDAPLVLLAESADGYSNLCRLLTAAHLRDRTAPSVTLDELEAHHEHLFCLTGGRGSRLWHYVDEARSTEAHRWVRRLRAIFGDYLSIEVSHHMLPGDTMRVRRLHALSKATSVPLVATGDARYAVPGDYTRYDLLTCVRLGQTVFDPHPERPRNAEAYLRSEATLRRLIPFAHAFDRAGEIARACHVDLLPGYITPPAARLPPGEEPGPYLRRRCMEALRERYTGEQQSRALAQLNKELDVIHRLELDEFFLVVHEIVSEAKRRGIRCAGRGSAANSIVAYLLDITGVDPLAHNLLFERFLHGGRRGTPDIDVDFDSERRHEIIAWMEERFGIEQTAMTATVVTYGLRSALRDAAKALGWPLEVVNRLSKAVPPRSAHRVHEYRADIERVLGASPLVEKLVESVASLEGCPRHLGLHSGGMILSRQPLHRFTPVQVSANGVKVTQFDKDDVEALGLVKFDVLGLRMLATLSEAAELQARHEATPVDIDTLPLDDIPTFNMIRAGKTLGVFQIESQGQLHLLAMNQPESFDDLIVEIALFRPGPLQGGMVRPFIRRRRGVEPVEYDHPSLEPILRDTYGVILFQEQVLDIAHRFAGMPLERADEFRRLMSKFRDPGGMEEMRREFVSGAVTRGVSRPVAHRVFDQVANFVGYGFCRSHAAAFARTVYQSAYLKCHHPAAFMAAIMQHRPGMYNLMTLEEEARRFGVTILPPDIHRSGLRYDLERRPDGDLAIRKPLTSVKGLSDESARGIVWERLQRPFSSLQDFYERVSLDREVLEHLARSGALDAFSGSSRKALWEVGLLHRRLGPAGQRPSPGLFDLPAYLEEDIPPLPPLTESERLSWDYQTHRAARRHPMTLIRRTLNELEIRPIETCYAFGRHVPRPPNAPPPVLTVAGISILRQRPPTAKGVMFLTLEDETGFIQCVIYPHVLGHLDHVLSQAALIVRGKLQIDGNWRGLVVTQAWHLNGIFGGYEGYPSHVGGRDRWIQQAEQAAGVLRGLS